MSKVTLAGVTCAIMLAVAACWAGPPDSTQTIMHNSADKVTARPSPASLTASAGEQVSFKINVHIAQGWHLYAHEDTMFIGVDVQPVVESFPLTELGVDYPAGKVGEFFGEPTVMIEGDEVLTVTASVPPDLPSGKYPVELALTVQACNDKMCLAPADIPVNLKLTVK